MNLTCNRAALSAALKVSASTTAAEEGHAQLSCVLMRAKAGTLTLIATDLNVTSIVEVPCAGTGEAVVGAKLADAMVGSLGSEDVTLSLDGGMMTIRGGKRKNQLPTVGKPADFPRVVSLDEVAWQTVSGSALGEVIAGTKDAASQDMTRPMLAGVSLEAGGGVIRGTSGDGKRLHRFERTSDAAFQAGVIPSRGCAVIAALCGEGDMEIGRTSHLICVRRGTTTIAAKLNDASFPSFDAVFPGKNSRLATFARKDVADTLSRAKMVTGKEHKDTGAIPVWFDIVGKEAKFKAANKDGFDAEDVLDVEHSGEAIASACNPDFLTSALKALGGDKVTLRAEDELAPLLFHRSSDTVSLARGDLVIIMPQRRG